MITEETKVSQLSDLDTSEIVAHLRTLFDAEVSNEFCVTADETQEYLDLDKGNSEIVASALKNVGLYLKKQAEKGNRFQEEEIVSHLVPKEIAAILEQPKPSQVPEHILRIKADRKRRASHEDLKAEIERRASQQLSDHEFNDLWETSGHRQTILLQAARLTGNLVTKFDLHFSHDKLLQKLSEYVQREMNKLPKQ